VQVRYTFGEVSYQDLTTCYQAIVTRDHAGTHILLAQSRPVPGYAQSAACICLRQSLDVNCTRRQADAQAVSQPGSQSISYADSPWITDSHIRDCYFMVMVLATLLVIFPDLCPVSRLLASS
jgi:hypothetical protein